MNNGSFLICPRGPEYEMDDVFSRIPYLRTKLKKRFNGVRPDINTVYRVLDRMKTPVFPTFQGKTPNGQPVAGFLPVLPQPGRQLLGIHQQSRPEFFSRVFHALAKIESHGSALIGLGTLFGSNLTYGGLLLARDKRAPKVPMNSGASLTAASIWELVEKVINDFEIDREYVRIAIIGAGGIVGYGTSQGLGRKLSKKAKLFLVDHQSKRMVTLESWVKKSCKCGVKISDQLAPLEDNKIDIVVVVTGANEFKLYKGIVPKGSLVIDCTTPRNTSLTLAHDPERLVIDGDLLWAPEIKHFDYGTPPNTIFACHGENIVLGKKIQDGLKLEPGTNNPYLGITEYETVMQIQEWAREFGLQIPPHHSFGERISRERILSYLDFRRSVIAA